MISSILLLPLLCFVLPEFIQFFFPFCTGLLLSILAFYWCIHRDNQSCFQMKTQLYQLSYLICGFFFRVIKPILWFIWARYSEQCLGIILLLNFVILKLKHCHLLELSVDLFSWTLIRATHTIDCIMYLWTWDRIDIKIWFWACRYGMRLAPAVSVCECVGCSLLAVLHLEWCFVGCFFHMGSTGGWCRTVHPRGLKPERTVGWSGYFLHFVQQKKWLC